jgi:hypothetical protein
MGIINLNDILKIRQQAEQFLQSTCTLLRFTGAVSIDGEISSGYAAPTTIACRIINRSGDVKESVAAQFRAIQQSSTQQLYRLQIPYAVDVSIRDKIVYNNKTYLIKYVPIKHEMMGAQIIFIEEVI